MVGMEHGARNIKRGMKETAVAYATRKSSSEKLHPSHTQQLGLSHISMTSLRCSRICLRAKGNREEAYDRSEIDLTMALFLKHESSNYVDADRMKNIVIIMLLYMPRWHVNLN